MKTKTFLFATTFMMMAACMMMNTSCTKYAMDDVVENGGSQEAVDGKEHVKLNLSAAVPEAETRGSLQVDGKELTDIFILDYDKTSGKLLQVLHQTNSAADFAEPDMTLAYGEHTLKVIATRSISPTLLDADKADWAIDDNVLTAISNSEPASWTSDKTSDSFGAEKDVSVAAGKVQAVNILMERIVAKLVLNCTDQFPDDCSTLQMDMDEYKSFSWSDFNVIGAEKNQRVSDVTNYIGSSNVFITYFLLVPEEGYSTDITFTMGRKDSDKPYSTFTVPDVQFERNKITTIKGQYFNHQSGVTFSLKTEWNKKGIEVYI
jgi:hypothetical protein|nr:MAG TPA: hypothetical protein [Caudoviricetes sp.]